MKQFMFLFTALFMLYSCNYTTGSGNIISQKRQLSNFTGINVGGSFDVEVKMGAATEVMVEADDNLMKYIVTNVSGDVLNIHTEHLQNIGNSHMKVYITMPVLKSIDASASADVKVAEVIKYDGKLNFEASSSADIEASVDAPEVAAAANSSGSIALSGKTKNYKATASSSGHVKSADLLTENAVVSANSSGSVSVHASVSLTADASSSGDITYRGTASVKKDESSSGSIEKKD
jgi:Putative auto-transporter adhesin, head GIN domain